MNTEINKPTEITQQNDLCNKQESILKLALFGIEAIEKNASFGIIEINDIKNTISLALDLKKEINSIINQDYLIG
ncbi:hypothetical protein P3875_01225 [Myroides sp. JBRI-B21084]|uniref:hypothetical protein n=1 Tax=Myroides sp. JBRI-B21084 TaxID=3119977 RepID=UPI0026E1CC8E|nr:hypothetical protein [Paenimyroides cloacae]WKW46722.1 hypothetical protein P3875_01225 [Paenimyroides cloacae]